MGSSCSGAVVPRETHASTVALVACSSGCWPMTATGAASQRPTQGTRWTRAVGGNAVSNSRQSASLPNIAHVTDSHTRTVIGGGGGASSSSTSK